VSFPGGVEEAEDLGDPVVTALRETNEEIGLNRESIQVLGLFDEALSINSLLGASAKRAFGLAWLILLHLVTPVIGFIGNFEGSVHNYVKTNPDEIEDVFAVLLGTPPNEHFPCHLDLTGTVKTTSLVMDVK